MEPKKIVITGITGFIGSHMAEEFLKRNYEVIGLKRPTSDCWRCNNFLQKITWINTEDNFIDKIVALKPAVVLHCAWDGAAAAKREDSNVQKENLLFLKQILTLVEKLKVEKFIGLGSQAEYGYLDKPVNENAALKPVSEYGKVKVMACDEVQLISDHHGINWYWLRLFSFYGPREAENWFIPSIINSLISASKEIKLSAGTQQYAYLYVKDLVNYVVKLIEENEVPKGIYNLSGSRAVELKQIVLAIKKQFKNSTTELQFGALPPRENQSVYLKGAMDKYHKNIGKIKTTPFSSGIRETIAYYKSKAI
jgi:nucleoside-diphosphate-sugar epimerase